MDNVLDSNETIVNVEILEETTDFNTSKTEDLTTNEEVEVLESNVFKIEPKVFKGQTIDRVVLDYTKVTGRAMILAEKQFIHAGFLNTTILSQSLFFQMIIASKISGIHLDFFLDCLKGDEVTEICTAVQVFLQTRE